MSTLLNKYILFAVCFAITVSNPFDFAYPLLDQTQFHRVLHERTAEGSTRPAKGTSAFILELQRGRSDSPTPKLLFQTQIQNYLNGHGMVLNLHLTHHAGTAFCTLARANGPCPEFACNPKQNESVHKEGAHDFAEWNWDSPPYHMIGWEFGAYDPIIDFNAIHWEDPHIVSVFITRETISRLLVPGPDFFRWIGIAEEGARDPHYKARSNVAFWNKAIWNKYLRYWKVNNFVVTILSQEELSEQSLNAVKQLLSRFTFILDADWLDENLAALRQILNWTNAIEIHKDQHLHRVHEESVQERINDDKVCRKLLQRNEYDIALHQWLKTKSLVRCP